MAFVVDDLEQAVADVVVHLAQAGYRLDFTPASLWEVDRFFDEHGPEPAVAGESVVGKGPMLFALGGYVGEVLRRALGGTWFGDDDDPESEVNVELRLADGSIVWPVQRVMKRYAHGSEDGIVVYGVALGLLVGDPPKPAGYGFKVLTSALHDPSPSATRQVKRWFADRRRKRG